MVSAYIYIIELLLYAIDIRYNTTLYVNKKLFKTIFVNVHVWVNVRVWHADCYKERHHASDQEHVRVFPKHYLNHVYSHILYQHNHI